MRKLSLFLSLTATAALLFLGCETNLVDQQSSSTGKILQDEVSAGMSQDSSVEGQYLILFKGNKIPKGFEKDIASAGGTIIYQHESGFAFVGGLSEDAASNFESRKDVSEFAANASFSLNLPTSPTTASAEVASPSDPATAFFYARQWHHEAIGADQAWATGYLGDSDVTVAVLDGGIDYTNLDLAGLVDLSRSISFVPFDDDLVDTFFPGKNYITDLQYHGTHVAATIASNALIGAGVTSQTTLMGVKVCNINGSCNFGAIFSGLLFSAENGADIINMSLGGAFIKAGNGQLVGFINSLMNQVRSSGALVVVAAGNGDEFGNGINLDKDGVFYDAFCDSPNSICVSATGPTASAGINGPWTDVDTPTSYTNFGRSAIDVAAPGGNSVAAVWATCSQTSLVVPDCQTGNFIIGLGGTSMATPHVSGLAALLKSQGINKPSQIKSKILQSADDLGQNGTDPYYGKGRINVPNALGL